MLTKSRFYKYKSDEATESALSHWGVLNGNGGRRNLRSVWQFATSAGHGNHVAAFPIELPLRCISATSDPGDLVFDPFAGSGTTLVAAKLLGRRYLGCDTSSAYVDEATARLAVTPDRLPTQSGLPLTLAEMLERYRIDGSIDEAADREQWEAEAAKDALRESHDQ